MKARILEGSTITATDDLGAIKAAIAAQRPIWIQLDAQDAATDALMRDDLHMHPLTIEDIWEERTTPKVDNYSGYLYVLVHGVKSAKTAHRIQLVELDLAIGPTWLVTRDPGDLVTTALAAECERSSRLLVKGIPWLAHAALDHAVDRYLPVIDQLDGEIDRLQDDVLDKAGTPNGRGVLTQILSFKRTLQDLRRTGIHQREILLRLSRGEFEQLPADVLPFYRDVYDHFLRVGDIAEGYRDLVTSALDAYLSVQSNRMNEIMKTLTLMSTVMLPLTFIAGVYGMNFKHMPETEWIFGYPMAVGFMAAVAGGIFLWFRRRGWIGARSS